MYSILIKCVRKSVWIAAALIAFGSVFADAQAMEPTNEEVIIELNDDEFVTETAAAGLIFGIPKYKLMVISGPFIWFLMLAGIVMRYIRMKGKTKALIRWHKVFGYSAFAVGTCHGFIGLFF